MEEKKTIPKPEFITKRIDEVTASFEVKIPKELEKEIEEEEVKRLSGTIVAT